MYIIQFTTCLNDVYPHCGPITEQSNLTWVIPLITVSGTVMLRQLQIFKYRMYLQHYVHYTMYCTLYLSAFWSDSRRLNALKVFDYAVADSPENYFTFEKQIVKIIQILIWILSKVASPQSLTTHILFVRCRSSRWLRGHNISRVLV